MSVRVVYEGTIVADLYCAFCGVPSAEGGSIRWGVPDSGETVNLCDECYCEHASDAQERCDLAQAA